MLNNEIDSKMLTRLIKGFGVNAYQQVLVIIIQLAGVPIILHYWGAQVYGEWLILSAIPSYLSMADLGFSLSAGNDMTGRVARGDTKGTLAVFQSLAVLVFSLIFIGIILCSVLFSFMPINGWMHLTIIKETDSRWILWLLGVSVLIQQFDGVNHAGFRAHSEYAFHSFFSSTTLFFQQIALWFAAINGYGPVLAALLMLVIRLFNTNLMTILLLRRHTKLQLGIKYANRKILLSLVKPAVANMAIPLAQAINIQGMVLVIGATLNPLAVVTFSTIRTLTRFAYQMILSISYAFEPEMAATWGKNDRVLLGRLYITNLRLSFWLAQITVIMLFFMGNWILSVWTHGKVVMDTMLFIWLLISALASVLWFGGLNLLKAGNRHLKAAFWYVIASIVAIGLAYILLRITGRIQVAGLSLVLMDLLMVLYVFQTASENIGQSSKKTFLSMLDLYSLIADTTEKLNSRKKTLIDL